MAGIGGLQLLAARHAFRCAHEISHLIVATALRAAVVVGGRERQSDSDARARVPELCEIWSVANLKTALCGSHVVVPKFGGRGGRTGARWALT